MSSKSSAAAPSPPDDLLPPGSTVDLTNCDREPIHIPGSIQPHGVLLTLEESELRVVQASENAASVLGAESLGAMLGQSVADLLGSDAALWIRRLADSEKLDGVPVYAFTLAPRHGKNPDSVPFPPLTWTLHRSGGRIVIEGEFSSEREENTAQFDVGGLVRRAIPRLRTAPDMESLCQRSAEEVRAITGFDRVMIYRFDPDGHGQVIAEVAKEGLDSFLGLHYPASDIPQQARRLYVLNTIRLIADVGYTPVPLAAAPGSGDDPLDMSFCSLRSVSPIHIEYLKNMGVEASMSLSIVEDGKLWGLVACHHYAPRRLPYDVRAACEVLAQMISLQIMARRDQEDDTYRTALRERSSRIIAKMAEEEDYRVGLYRHKPTIKDLLDCTGAAVVLDGRQCVRLGEAPPSDDILRLVEFLSSLQEQNEIFATDHLSSVYAAGREFARTASGVLALPLSRDTQNYLLWFRPEVVRTVNWAGNPEKAVVAGDDGTARLSPRRSFAKWQQEMHFRSLPWKRAELEAVRELQRAISTVILSKAEVLARLNRELIISNTELDSFAYVASHDLKEPLRGISNYVQFLQEDYRTLLPEEAQAQLNTVKRLAHRMDGLLDSLLHYSRLGRVELELRPCDLNAILTEVQEALHSRISETGVEVRVPRSLPIVSCDAVQMGEVFTNLLSNAIKYNNREAGRWVEIGIISPEELDTHTIPPGFSEDQPLFYVRDNGIGIDEKHRETVFRIFRRLHARDAFGGGSGAGLTITRRIIERHGGRIDFSSTPGEGTTFFFSLDQRKGKQEDEKIKK
ncbi:MAG: ATP-binding protein [Armatimonadaceae bacterium]